MKNSILNTIFKNNLKIKKDKIEIYKFDKTKKIMIRIKK
jgi:hypothetical protein